MPRDSQHFTCQKPATCGRFSIPLRILSPGCCAFPVPWKLVCVDRWTGAWVTFDFHMVSANDSPLSLGGCIPQTKPQLLSQDSVAVVGFYNHLCPCFLGLEVATQGCFLAPWQRLCPQLCITSFMKQFVLATFQCHLFQICMCSYVG